jgi:hypothetical protein
MTTPPPRRRRSRLGLVLLVIASLLGALLLLPAFLWTVNLIKCGHRPIETSDFAAANSYTLPGDGTYTYYPIFSGYACDLREVGTRSHNTL